MIRCRESNLLAAVLVPGQALQVGHCLAHATLVNDERQRQDIIEECSPGSGIGCAATPPPVRPPRLPAIISLISAPATAVEAFESSSSF